MGVRITTDIRCGVARAGLGHGVGQKQSRVDAAASFQPETLSSSLGGGQPVELNCLNQ